MKIKTSKRAFKSDVTVKFVTSKQAKRIPELKRLGKTFSVFTNLDTTYISVENVETNDDWREVGFKLVRHLNGLNVSTVSIKAPKLIRPFVEGLLIGDYKFDLYKSEKKNKPKLKKIHIHSPEDISTIVLESRIVVSAQLLVRDLVNNAAADATSITLSDLMMEMFAVNDSNISVEIYDEAKLEELGMNGHLAVNSASRNPAVTVKLEYTPKKWKKHVVLVGKGLTYDSGGLSIKPTDSMLSMKSDKAGAMTVLGIMNALNNLGCKHKVTAYIAMAENMISGDSYRPGDVLTMKNGKTVHVKNTDAEGRIVLFDNLCLAEEENPDFDAMYTFATLTGAALASFGLEAAGMVGFNDDMKAVVKEQGEEAGEIFCNAEFHKYTLKGVEDNLADLSNTGSKYQGCHKAGLFLTNALTKEGKKKYLHLDIAGPAFASAPFGTNIAGGTGFAVRTFLNVLRNLK